MQMDLLKQAQIFADLDEQELEAVAEFCRGAHREGLVPDQVDLSHAPYPEPIMRVAITRGLLELL